jgi:hypothetical protein
MAQSLAAWSRELRARCEHYGVPPLSIVLGVAAAICPAWRDVLGGSRVVSAALDPESIALPDGIDASPTLLGLAYEATLADAVRRAGAHYTPAVVARRLTDIALTTAGTRETPAVCDPAAGGGAFLLAAAGALARERRSPRAAILRDLVWGADVDPGAVAVAEAALLLWAAEDGAGARMTSCPNLVVADAIAAGPAAWTVGRGPFDVVIGNPPFQSPLDASHARTAAAVDRLRARFGDAVRPYANTAGLFLLAALDLVRPGGVVAMIQPVSLLAARDAAGVRDAVDASATVAGLWVAGERVFGADVRVCAPVIVAAPAPAATTVDRWRGAAIEPATAVVRYAGTPWASLARGLTAAPAPVPLLRHGRTLGDWCTATAGFRDEYYGLVPAVGEQRDARAGTDQAPLVTAGLVDPARCHWGRRPARFARRRFDAPTVSVSALDPAVRRWVDARRRPKVVVGTQTKVVEAAVDEAGAWVPSVPVLSVECDAADLWHVAAALLAPAVSAFARDRWCGTALLDDTIKLAARDIASLPAPRAGIAWDDGAVLVRAASSADDEATWRDALAALGAAMGSAYGIGADHPVRAWWEARLPRW